jgi:hypothetical protein
LSPSPSILVMTANDNLMPLVGVGSIVTPHLSLSNVYFIPKLRLNLVFVDQLYDLGDYLFIFPLLFVMYRICSLRS